MTSPTPAPAPSPVPTGWRAFLAALKGGGWVSVLTALVTIATTYGLLSTVTATGLETAAAAVVSALNAIVALVHNVQGARAVRSAALASARLRSI